MSVLFSPFFQNKIRNKQTGYYFNSCSAQVFMKLLGFFLSMNLWAMTDCLILGYLQMNRWRCCCKNVTQHCLGSQWPPNIISDSPEGLPDFRLQQYLVAVMPHCTHSSQICIAINPLVDSKQKKQVQFAHILPCHCVYGFIKLSYYWLKTWTHGSNRSAASAGILVCACLVHRPHGGS